MRDDLLAAAIIRRGETVLLVHNFWPVGDAWNLPGGRREPGETLAETLAREVLEETGLRVTGFVPAYVLDVHVPDRSFNLLWHVFACEAEGEAAAPTGDEFVRDLAWVPAQRLSEHLWPTYCVPLNDYLQGVGKGYYIKLDAGWGK